MIINCEDCCSKYKDKLETNFTLEEQCKIKQYCEDLKIEWDLQYKQYEDILKYSTENKDSKTTTTLSFISQSEYKKNIERNNILEFNQTPEDNIKHLFSLINNNNNNNNNNNRFQYYNNNNNIIIKYIKGKPKIILCYVNKKISIGVHIID